MTVCCCLLENWFSEIQLFYDSFWTEIEIVLDRICDYLKIYFFCTKTIEIDTYWLGYSNCISELNFTFVANGTSYNVFGKVSRDVSSASIYFCRILSRESSTSMSSNTTVTIYDNFSSCESCISNWSTYMEVSCWIDMIFSVFID